MNRHVRSSQIFSSLLDSMRTDYRTMLDGVFGRVEEDINARVQNIFRDMGTITTEEGEIAEAAQDRGLAQRVRTGVTTVQARLAEAHAIVDRLQANA
ncbi:uncharacterized protein BDV14DRAFT_87837 [Aspergillus stella-maris]|uniref:uncharacterized protein n=1 Tax=Aspergillus stella-maris TaxID=1810926 RepID=UPI003CCE46A4